MSELRGQLVWCVWDSLQIRPLHTAFDAQRTAMFLWFCNGVGGHDKNQSCDKALPVNEEVEHITFTFENPTEMGLSTLLVVFHGVNLL